jgi:hypothetical protein
MKWFKKMLWRWISEGREIYEREDDKGGLRVSRSRLISQDDCDVVSDDPILNFKVFNAVGGKVVEFRRYDRKNDRNDSTTYIITNDQDFGERIAKIAMMENLKL